MTVEAKQKARAADNGRRLRGVMDKKRIVLATSFSEGGRCDLELSLAVSVEITSYSRKREI